MYFTLSLKKDSYLHIFTSTYTIFLQIYLLLLVNKECLHFHVVNFFIRIFSYFQFVNIFLLKFNDIYAIISYKHKVLK